eukprot:g6843.t1
MDREYGVIVALSENGGIGFQGDMPWSIPSDLAHFYRVTTSVQDPTKHNVVIMGRHTWNSIPSKYRPLPKRLNIVLTHHPDQLSEVSSQVLTAESLNEAMELINQASLDTQVENVYVIGGRSLFEEAMQDSNCISLHVTLVEGEFNCDTYFPKINQEHFRLWSATSPILDKTSSIRFSHLIYTRSGHPSTGCGFNFAIQHEEYQYLDLIEEILNSGSAKEDRTGTGTLSKFGKQMKFNLRHYFPLLTSKRVFWRGVVEELLWIISGSTNAKVLQEKGIHIWDGNASREFLDRVGLHHREEGDLGPVYGFQWRHFGAKYTHMSDDYTGQGVDQLAEVIRKLRENPTDRRILLSSWNPTDLKLMALPPCHMFCQFYVSDGELSCQMYQRSCDMGLGVPFNIASYALLTCMIAQVTGFKRGDFIHVLGDAHVYNNHIEPLKKQLLNKPNHFPVHDLT